MSDNYFFCTSHREAHIHCAVLATARIAEITSETHVLCLRSVPWYSSLLKNISLVNEFPEDLLGFGPRGVHVDTVENDTDLYINVWVNQQRGSLNTDNSGPAAIKNVIKQSLQIMGKRKLYLTKKSIFWNALPDPSDYHSSLTNIDPWLLKSKKVCFFPGAKDQFKNAEIDLANFFSANSTLLFFALDAGAANSNVHDPGVELYPVALKNSDTIIAADAYSLIPFNKFLKNKKVILMSKSPLDSFLLCRKKINFVIEKNKQDETDHLNELCRLIRKT